MASMWWRQVVVVVLVKCCQTRERERNVLVFARAGEHM